MYGNSTARPTHVVREPTLQPVDLAVAGLTGTFGFVPYWFGEFHLAVTIVALLAILAGAVDHLRTGRRVELPSP